MLRFQVHDSHRRARFLAVAVLAAGLGTSCSASLPVDELAPSIPAEALQLEPGYDLCFMRIDLRRQFRTETTTTVDATGRPIMQTRSVPVPYHYLGVDLGNGLFLDANLNLALDVLRLQKLHTARNFSVEKQRRSFYPVSADSTCRRNDTRLVTEAHGLLGSSQTAELGDQAVVLEGGFLSSEQRIEIEADGLVYDPQGIFGAWMRIEVRRTADGVRLSDYPLRLSDDTIYLGNAPFLRREADALLFPPAPGLFSDDTPSRLRLGRDTIAVTEGEDWKLRVDHLTGSQLTARRAGWPFDSVSDFFITQY